MKSRLRKTRITALHEYSCADKGAVSKETAPFYLALQQKKIGTPTRGAKKYIFKTAS